jgi:hypothetical protein
MLPEEKGKIKKKKNFSKREKKKIKREKRLQTSVRPKWSSARPFEIKSWGENSF